MNQGNHSEGKTNSCFFGDDDKTPKKSKKSKGSKSCGAAKRPRSKSTKSRTVKRQKCSPNRSKSTGKARVRFSGPVGVNNRRRPPAPFLFYYLSFLKDAQRKAGKGNCAPRILVVVKQAAKCWNKLSKEEKEVYRKRYCKELAQIKGRRGNPPKGKGC